MFKDTLPVFRSWLVKMAVCLQTLKGERHYVAWFHFLMKVCTRAWSCLRHFQGKWMRVVVVMLSPLQHFSLSLSLSLSLSFFLSPLSISFFLSFFLSEFFPPRSRFSCYQVFRPQWLHPVVNTQIDTIHLKNIYICVKNRAKIK